MFGICILFALSAGVTVCTALVVAPGGNSQAQSIYQAYEGVHVLGGTKLEFIVTENNCILACQRDEGCKAVDFHKNDNACWFHYASTACGARVPKADCTHTQMTNMCVRTVNVSSCFKLEFDGTVVRPPQIETRISGYHLRGGSLMSTYRDMPSCIVACYQDFFCQGVDFNAQWNTCWFHKAGTACKQMMAKQHCTHVKVKTGCETCPADTS